MTFYTQQKCVSKLPAIDAPRPLTLMLNVLLAAVTVAYPFLVYFSIDHMQPRYLALLLGTFFCLRWLSQKPATVTRDQTAVLLLPASVLFLIAVALSNEETLLLAYPVLVNVIFFCIFFASVLDPPTIVEKLARLREPDLPARGVRYTRTVTVVWCGFFLLNALFAIFTVWRGDRWLWSLYNGFIAYVLMGLLMAAEMWIRQNVRKSFTHAE